MWPPVIARAHCFFPLYLVSLMFNNPTKTLNLFKNSFLLIILVSLVLQASITRCDYEARTDQHRIRGKRALKLSCKCRVTPFSCYSQSKHKFFWQCAGKTGNFFELLFIIILNPIPEFELVLFISVKFSMIQKILLIFVLFFNK